MPRLTDLTVTGYTTPIELLVARVTIPNTELRIREDDFAGQVVVELQRRIAYIPGESSVNIPKMHVPEIRIPQIEVPTIEVPATWWDHFKQRNFKFLLRWLPVRYRTLQVGGVLQEGAVLQEAREVGGTFEARAYIPDVVLPRGQKEYRWHRIDQNP